VALTPSLLDFLHRLRSLETRYSGFLTEGLTEWGWYSWQGFFQRIQSEFEGAGWKYVPNQSGGFLGFAFAKSRVGDIEVLAHLEEEKMCFKISGVSDSGRRRAERTRWHRAIVRAAEQRDLRASKPARFGSGYSMTVAILTEDYRVGDSQGRIDVEATVSRLKEVERLVTHATTIVGE